MIKKQLFLLHFAGGNRYSYNFLKEYFDKEFEFIPMELPGRGNRLNEKLVTNKIDAVKDYINQIKSLRNNQPYLIYGHSMGASLGLLVAEKMEKIGDAPTISEEVLKNKEFYEFFNPIIRADFELMENDDYPEEGILLCTPIYALMGDREETVDNIENWRKFTSCSYSYKVLPGDHFFIYEHCDVLSKLIKTIISTSINNH